ncbi:MAG: hypothetical protein AB1846_19915 [Chloroflexota bacterium]
MSAPLIWIGLPLGLAGFLLLIRRNRLVAILGAAAALVLAGLAWFLPLDTVITIGSYAFKVAPTFTILGRSLTIESGNQGILTLIYGLAAMWFFGALATPKGRPIVSLGMAIVALLVASLAVEPFLYAALLIEIALLLCVPLLAPFDSPPQRGVLRFLIHQTLAMPFILFSGWMLAGVEASPGDLNLVIQAGTLLGLGFAFLLAIFPLYAWVPQISEESHPYAAAFVLFFFPTVTLLFLMGFIDRFAWLRANPNLPGILTSAGLLMVVSGGLWAAFQRDLGRMMGYGTVIETGLALLAIGQYPALGVTIFALLIVPRGLGMTIWSLSLSRLKSEAGSLRFSAVQGMIRSFPSAAVGVALSHLSLIGLPLLAGFPPRLALWEALARQSAASAGWYALGIAGALIGLVRTLAVLSMAPENTPWRWQDTWLQRILIGFGLLGMLIFGLFPQTLQPLLARLPLVFEFLGR